MSREDHSDRELDGELRAFLELLTEEKVRAGTAPAEARRSALLELGGLEQVKERVRAERPGALLRGLEQDLRYALRRLRREPAFSLFAAVIIGIGVGAVTAVYSVLSPLLVRPLPFAEPDRLVWVARLPGASASGGAMRASNLSDYRALNRSFEALTGYAAFSDLGSYNFVGDAGPERLDGVGIAMDFLDVLRVRPHLGRDFSPEEEAWGGPSAVILTHAFWTRRFHADRSVVGQVISLNGIPTEVVGVLPRSFDFASTFAPGQSVDILLPFPVSPETDRWGNTLALIGRLGPGASAASAQADLERVNRQLQDADPGRWGLGAVVVPLSDYISGSFRLPLLLLLSAAAAVLLVACANLSNLVLARSQGRTRELALRSALGAGRSRIARQLLIESVVLAGTGGCVGVLLAVMLTRALVALGVPQIPLLGTARVDVWALLFTVGVTIAAGVLVGIAPALQLPRGGEAGRLRMSGRAATAARSATLARNALVVTELACACVLIVGAGLLLRSFERVLDVELGFDPGGVYNWRVESDRSFESRVSAVAYYERLIGAVAALPGSDAVGLTDTPPFGRNRGWGIRLEGVPEEDYLPVSPRMVHGNYFAAMRIPLRAGRFFSPRDGEKAEPSLILNETAANALFPGQDPIGRLVLISAPQPRWRVVGVVGDVRHTSLEAAAGLEMYLPLTQSPDYAGLNLVLRSQLPLRTVAPDVRAALSRVDPALPTGDFGAIDSVLEQTLLPRRFLLLVCGGFAAVALLLAALGIYAVVSYSVSQRQPEIGVRLALGESPGRVRRRVLLDTLPTTIAGIAIGVGASLVLSRFLQSLLYTIEPTDPATYAAGSLLMLLVAMVAAYRPARRASALDPATALRVET